MGKRVRVERDGERDAPLPVGVTVITHRGRVEFIFAPASSPGASTCSSGSVCDLYFVLCSDDKCFRRPSESLQSRSFSVQKKSELHPYCLRSNVELFRVGKRRSGYTHAIL